MLSKLDLLRQDINYECRLNSFMTKFHVIWQQPIDLQSKLMDWFLYDRDLRHERANLSNCDHDKFEKTGTQYNATHILIHEYTMYALYLTHQKYCHK